MAWGVDTLTTRALMWERLLHGCEAAGVNEGAAGADAWLMVFCAGGMLLAVFTKCSRRRVLPLLAGPWEQAVGGVGSGVGGKQGTSIGSNHA